MIMSSLFTGATVIEALAAALCVGSLWETAVSATLYSPAVAPGGTVTVTNRVPSSPGSSDSAVGAPRIPQPSGTVNERSNVSALALSLVTEKTCVANSPGATSLSDERTPTFTPEKAENETASIKQTIKLIVCQDRDRFIIAKRG